MGDGALGSDHVNYLVLRYLQESGFETAAKSLYREWYRNDEYRDPEDFPFAPAVKQSELVHIIQDGLFHDQIQATVANGARRFNLTSADVEFQPQRTKSISRRQSVYTSNDRDDFAIPPAKRVRQSNASDAVVNGDAMDVDERPDDDDRTSNISDQDQAHSESEPTEQAVVETKAMGTQTDKAKKEKKVKTRTVYWSIDKDLPVSILHTGWSPADVTRSFLLAAGESLLRIYEVSPFDDDMQGIRNLDPLAMGPEHTVTAVAWHPSGQYLTCAVQAPPRVDGVDPYKMHLIDVSTSGDKRSYDDLFNMVTIVLRYTRSGRTLFAASSDGQRSVLEVRDLTSPQHRQSSTAFEYVEDNVVMDIAPISDTSFAICGKGLVSVWSLGSPEAGDRSQPLTQEYIHTVPADVSFDKVRYDWRHEVLVAIATSSGHVCTLRKDGDSWTHGSSLTLPADAGRQIAAICFEPAASPDDKAATDPVVHDDVQLPTRLAIALVKDQSGHVCVYNTTSDSIELVAELELKQQEPPLALSWRPRSTANGDQSWLAAGSDEAITVWDVSDGSAREILSWKAAPANWYQGDDNHLPDDEDATEPSLSFDAKGERLLFAVGRKMAVVAMMQESEETNGVNGLAEHEGPMS